MGRKKTTRAKGRTHSQGNNQAAGAAAWATACRNARALAKADGRPEVMRWVEATLAGEEAGPPPTPRFILAGDHQVRIADVGVPMPCPFCANAEEILIQIKLEKLADG